MDFPPAGGSIAADRARLAQHFHSESAGLAEGLQSIKYELLPTNDVISAKTFGGCAMKKFRIPAVAALGLLCFAMVTYTSCSNAQRTVTASPTSNEVAPFQAVVTTPVNPSLSIGNGQLGNYLLIPTGSDIGSISHTPTVVYTRDGKSRFIATSNGKAVSFDEKDKLDKKYQLFEGQTSAMAVDQESGKLYAVSMSGEFRALEAADGKELVTKKIDGALYVAVNEKKGQVAVAGSGGITIMDAKTMKELKTIACGAVNAVAFDESGSMLAAGISGNAGTKVFDTANFSEKYSVASDGSNTYSVAFTADSKLLATGGFDRAIKIWDAQTGACIKDKLDDQPYYITALGFSPCGKYLAVGDESCDVWEYQTSDWQRIMHGKHHHECWLQSVAWSPDSSTFLFGCRPNSYNNGGGLQTADPDIYAVAYNDPEVQAMQKKLDGMREELVKKEPDLKNSFAYAGGYYAQNFAGDTAILEDSITLGINASEAPQVQTGAAMPQIAQANPKTEEGKKIYEEMKKQQEVLNKKIQEHTKVVQDNFCVKQFKNQK